MKRAVRIGRVRWKSAGESDAWRIGVGLEKLDRDLYDPEKCYDDLAAVGAKWVRIQSGWCRTEKVKGVYDFTWLDSIVDNLIERGMRPWICLCYGNGLYTPGADNSAGAVGCPPIRTEEERSAWDRYVAACVGRYRGRVGHYEIWNEPDGNWCWRPQANAPEYRAFALRTAKVIRRTDPEAKIFAGSFCTDLKYLYRFLDRELASYIDDVTYHRYTFSVEKGTDEYVAAIDAYVKSLDPRLGVIQGETGAPSRWSTQGAMKRADWTERKQAKYLLRKTVSDLMTDVLFTSYFSTVDIFENIQDDYVNITEKWYGFFGLLGETFDKDGKPLGQYRRKDSFTAMRTLCAVFGSDVRPQRLPVLFEGADSTFIGGREMTPADPDARLKYGGFIRKGGASAFVYWKAADVLTEEYESTVSLRVFAQPGPVRIIDLYTGEVFEPDGDLVTTGGGETLLSHMPIRDYPLMVTFGDFAPVENI